MPPVNRGFSSSLLTPQLHSIYVETGKERPLEFTEVMNVKDMPWNPITIGQYSGLGTMPEKPEGTQYRTDEPLTGGTKTYTAAPWGMAFEVTYEMWRDELFGLMEEMTKELKRASRYRLEVNAWSVLNNGFSTSFTGFEASKSLFSTSHVDMSGTTKANRPSVEIGISVAGLQAMTTAFENMTNARGLPQLMVPRYIIVGPSQRFITREILGSSGAPYKADNEINSLIQENLSWMVSHHKTSATSWFAMAPKNEHDLNFWYRDRPSFDSWDDPTTKNAVFAAYQRHTEGFGSWQGTYGSTG